MFSLFGDSGYDISKVFIEDTRLKDCLDGDTLLDNCDLAQLLGVTQRTIARYREKGLIRYYQTDENGKNFYRSSEIQEFLRQRGKKKSAQ
ncbi:helix-turn-helix domain-containing protein [Bacteroides thetaiotaomicron]|uniref:helix-turn-helix domain-containing protein n=1 Tax=Bacteroides thetaiotaomicron TaxID=818 RepID=UPI001E4A1D44|nr:helix-turn-helix domain-containing protein [Bacteroides thetaiotaomicron]